MGEAKRRKQLGLPPRVNPAILQIEQVPERWSIAFMVKLDRQIVVTLAQGEPDPLKGRFLETVKQAPDALDRLDKGGMIAVANPNEPMQLLLMHPDRLRENLKTILQEVTAVQMQFVLVVLEESDESLDDVLSLWRQLAPA